MSDVFFSYSFKDQLCAEDILNRLTNQYGISCWMCTRELREKAGSQYEAEIVREIRKCKVVVLVYSKNAAQSVQIPQEVGIAFDFGKMIIPFLTDASRLMDNDNLYYKLRGKEYIDGQKPEFEDRIRDLADSIFNVIGRPEKKEEAAAPVLQSTGFRALEHLYGRDALLQEIGQRLGAQRIVFLQGMGGIGKSEIALKYARQHEKEYDTIVFARYGQSLAALLADDREFAVQGCMRKTNADNTQQSDEEYARDKLRALEKADARTLIIIDNFDTRRDDLLEEMTSARLRCHMLFTTRYTPADPERYAVIHVGEMADDALREMVCAYSSGTVEKDDPFFPALLDWSARHTKTLELMAKYMAETSCSISEMMETLQRGSLKTAAEEDDEMAYVYGRIRELFHLTQLNAQEKEYLRNLSLMPAGGVDRELFKSWCGKAYAAHNRLKDRGLVQVDGKGQVALHPIVREVVIAELKPDYPSCKAFVDKCAMMDKPFTGMEHMWALPYEKKKAYLDCYAAILSFAAGITEDNFDLYMNMSNMFNYIGSFRETLDLLKRMLAFAEEKYGKTSVQALAVCERIAWKYATFEDNESALIYNQVIADHYLQHPDYTNKQSYTVIQRCGELYLHLFKRSHCPEHLEKTHYYLEKADKYGQIMLEEARKRNDPEIHYYVHPINALYRIKFSLYLQLEEYEKALDSLRRYETALESFISEHEEVSSVDMASVYHCYGRLYCAMKDYGAAIDYLEKAYDKYLEFFSAAYLRLVNIGMELLFCYLSRKEFGKAREYHRRMKEIAHAQLTADHPLCLQLQEYDRQLKEAGY